VDPLVLNLNTGGERLASLHGHLSLWENAAVHVLMAYWVYLNDGLKIVEKDT
jgi:hypothetical protein